MKRLGLGIVLLHVSGGCAAGTDSEIDAPTPSVGIQDGSNDVASPLNDAVVRVRDNCTGTLITSDWVLTAAHCVVYLRGAIGAPFQADVFVGVNAETRVAVDRCYMHPLSFPPTPTLCGQLLGGPYVPNMAYDLALLHLAHPVPRTLARPSRVKLTNSLASWASWSREPVTLRGWGYAGAYGGAVTTPTIRQVGHNVIAGTTTDQAWEVDRGAGVDPGAMIMSGDSGGPLLWNRGDPVPTLIGTASTGSTLSGRGTDLSAWSNTMLPASAAWINSVMTYATDASATVTTASGAVVPPPSGWQGEGRDIVDGDNCPNVFNPWQADADGDGVGDECDVAPSSGGAWGAATVSSTGEVLSRFSSVGAPITAEAKVGAYAVTMKQLGRSGGNVQVVATGESSTRCKVSGWGRTGPSLEHLTTWVQCHNAAGTPAPSSFVVFANYGASPQQGAYLYYDGSTAPAAYGWNSSGATNSVTRTGVGAYRATLPGMPTANMATHVTAYGVGPEYCNVSSWTLGTVNVQCYDAAGNPVDTLFSLMVSGGATRSGLVGGHAWVSAATLAPGGYQSVLPVAGASPAAATVTDFSTVTYPSTRPPTPLPVFPMTTAYGTRNNNFCKIVGSVSSGSSDTAVQSRCFNRLGIAQLSPFTQSFAVPTMP